MSDAKQIRKELNLQAFLEMLRKHDLHPDAKEMLIYTDFWLGGRAEGMRMALDQPHGTHWPWWQRRMKT